MALLGDRNWWMPRWLDRLVPRLSIEPATTAAPALDEELEPEPA
jgi:RND superfamily putative drug exporter